MDNIKGIYYYSFKDKINMLFNRMPNDLIIKVKSEIIDNSNDKDKCNTIIDRYYRQYGIPFKIKKRQLNLSRYNLGDNTIIHYALFFDKSGYIYHYLPDGIKYGEREYNKQISSYDWDDLLDT
jgi:hypothetical protein